jgi:hypothetical protein
MRDFHFTYLGQKVKVTYPSDPISASLLTESDVDVLQQERSVSLYNRAHEFQSGA